MVMVVLFLMVVIVVEATVEIVATNTAFSPYIKT